jgi:hypothetical protein
MVNRPRILLADDHALLLDAFKMLLEPAFQVVGAVTNGRAKTFDASLLRRTGDGPGLPLPQHPFHVSKFAQNKLTMTCRSFRSRAQFEMVG